MIAIKISHNTKNAVSKDHCISFFPYSIEMTFPKRFLYDIIFCAKFPLSFYYSLVNFHHLKLFRNSFCFHLTFSFRLSIHFLASSVSILHSVPDFLACIFPSLICLLIATALSPLIKAKSDALRGSFPSNFKVI